jgi:predicted SnoaL-like aldol condensation-catalyzing enzyme
VFKHGLEPGEPEMTTTIEEANKALVLEAFDTLFNQRDYKAAERFWSPNYIQHRLTSRRDVRVSSI